MTTEIHDKGNGDMRRDWLRLMTWLSPAFPVGGFSYSSGLEAAFRSGAVSDDKQLREWLETSLAHGSLWNDAVLLCAATHKDADIAAINELAIALAAAPGRHLETTAQGQAFARAASFWHERDGEGDAFVLPVALASAAAPAGVAGADAAAAFLAAAISSQVQAAIRLGVLGQDAAVGLQRALEETVLQTASRAAAAGLDGLGGCAILAEIAALEHETLDGRLFRS